MHLYFKCICTFHDNIVMMSHFSRFELYNIEYWGKSIPGQLVKEFPAQIVKGLAAEIYDLMMDDEQKIEGIFQLFSDKFLRC